MSQTSTETEAATATERPDRFQDGDGHSHAKEHGNGHSHWMMIACCVPMVLVAVFLVAGGAGLASLAPLIFCAAMMGLMMLGMSRMHGGR